APASGASAAASAVSPATGSAAAEEDERPRRPAVPGQPFRGSAARPDGAGLRVRVATQAARRLSRPGHAGYERARPAELERRDRGRRRPCRRSSHPHAPTPRHRYWRPSAGRDSGVTLCSGVDRWPPGVVLELVADVAFECGDCLLIALVERPAGLPFRRDKA